MRTARTFEFDFGKPILRQRSEYYERVRTKIKLYDCVIRHLDFIFGSCEPRADAALTHTEAPVWQNRTRIVLDQLACTTPASGRRANLIRQLEL